MASLVDTNILVHGVDPRDPVKQRVARDVLREGVRGGSLAIAHQSIVEFIAAVIRPCRDLNSQPLLPLAEARLEAEALMSMFRVIYPDKHVLQAAFRGTAMYGLSWFDAHLWAYAEVHGFAEILSEDFEHGRHYGSVRVVDPFLAAANAVHELPELYEP